MNRTTVGLPNSCSSCGKPQGKTWFAENDDLARSGQGYCSTCKKNLEKVISIKDEAQGSDELSAPEQSDLDIPSESL